MHRTLIATLIAVAAAAIGTAAASSGGGHTADQLVNAGWECVTPPGDNVHCTQSLAALGRDDQVSFRVFHRETGAFLGTELLVHEDAFKGQPCPTDPPSRQYTYLGPILGLPYFACHRYDSGF